MSDQYFFSLCAHTHTKKTKFALLSIAGAKIIKVNYIYTACPQLHSTSLCTLHVTSLLWPLLLLGHLAQVAHLEHVEIAAVELHNTLVAVNAQQVSGELTILTNYHFHLYRT